VSGTDDPAARRRPGELEAQVLEVLSGSDAPLVPGEVRDRLDPTGCLSYSAVVTTLSRLYEKGAVVREKDGRAFRYTAVGSGSSLVGWQMGRLLDADADHASVLSHFVTKLSDADAAMLRALLDHEL
jgi:predicted transcriptional regulator